jgi:protein-S-isoprenylcysteine O-methyltransferase Ste14
MQQQVYFLPALTFAVVMLCWFAFAAVFILRKKPPITTDQKRERGSLFGVLLQGIAYGVVWSQLHRRGFTPFVANETVALAASVIAMVAAIGSVWLIMGAVRTLGKEWSLTARVVEGHKLATTGPYAYVRHPIYTGMLGMLIATGLAVSHWVGLLVALILFFIGTVIRIRSEEKLLRAAFGEQFEVYSRRVSAILPGVY